MIITHIISASPVIGSGSEQYTTLAVGLLDNAENSSFPLSDQVPDYVSAISAVRLKFRKTQIGNLNLKFAWSITPRTQGSQPAETKSTAVQYFSDSSDGSTGLITLPSSLFSAFVCDNGDTLNLAVIRVKDGNDTFDGPCQVLLFEIDYSVSRSVADTTTATVFLGADPVQGSGFESVVTLAAGNLFQSENNSYPRKFIVPKNIISISATRLIYMRVAVGSFKLQFARSLAPISEGEAPSETKIGSAVYSSSVADGSTGVITIPASLFSGFTASSGDVLNVAAVRIIDSGNTLNADIPVLGFELDIVYESSEFDAFLVDRLYDDYLAEIESMVKDGADKLADDWDAILSKAITDWGRDVPLVVKKNIQGNGTAYYTLSTILLGLWKCGYSRISRIEYPVGQNPPEYLVDDEWDIYDDGSAQDGSNLRLMLICDAPGTSDYFNIEFSVEPIVISPNSQNFPDTNFNFSCITTLAASYACDRLAAAYAQSTDASISADVVDYKSRSDKYTSLSREYRKRYRILVFGSEDTTIDVKAALVQKELTPSTNQDNVSAAMGGVISSSYLFHRVKRR